MKFKKDKTLFNTSRVEMSFSSVAGINDAHFVIKENNFFEFYRLLFDSVKNSSYPGKYIKRADTLFLDFYDKKGKSLLGNRAVIDTAAQHITFFK